MNAPPGPAATTPVTQQFELFAGFDLNTDVRAVIEVKWLYTEFAVPLHSVPTTVRLGAQPFGARPPTSSRPTPPVTSPV